MNNDSLLYSKLIPDYKYKIIHVPPGTFKHGNHIRSDSTITGDLCNYVLNSLRLEPGDKFLLIDGTGKEYYEIYINTIARNKKNFSAQCRMVNIIDDIKRKKYNCFIGALKGTAAADTVERLTELGADSILFFRSKYSQCDISPEKIERFLKISISACSQSRRLTAPFIGKIEFSGIKNYIKDPEAASFLMTEPSLYPALASNNENQFIETFNGRGIYDEMQNGAFTTVNIISGPEGGFAFNEAAELAETRNNGLQILNLKNSVLRAEFAPQAALAIIKNRCGDL